MEQLPDGSALSVVAWAPSPGHEALGPQGRRTVLDPALQLPAARPSARG